MTVKEKIIKRLNKGFGFDIPLDAKWKTHQGRGCWAGMGAHKWYFCDIRLPLEQNVGSTETVSECLKWKRWVINKDIHDLEISEYFESQQRWYETHNYLIENID